METRPESPGSSRPAASRAADLQPFCGPIRRQTWPHSYMAAARLARAKCPAPARSSVCRLLSTARFTSELKPSSISTACYRRSSSLLSINFRGVPAERDRDRELVKGLMRCAPHSKLQLLSYAASILLLVVASAPGQSNGGKGGENIRGGSPSGPTFSKDVAPILFARCASCHRPGEVASAFPLLSYDNARSEAESIKKKVVRREMPPWPADPAKSLKFRNDPRLTQQEIDTLVAWVNAG